MSPKKKSKKVDEKVEDRGAEIAPETEIETHEPGELADAVELKDAEQETVARPPEQVIEGLSTELEELGVVRVSLGPGPMRATLALLRKIARELQGTGTYTNIMAETIPYAEVNSWYM